ncbi:GNAT family N-acetyltransferase [Lacticaseibacillus saniviri]|uniref:N-acetyltransferase domain-containing protein n=1 Tax=Lacticaseibacillus saniviri JCM 17471 = DSM 24301 TaxID=1293598 RepID=A0A0R2MP91_9LACO|nr:GNAT family N-acetyltransferase [Lacticaseibacillus saniviri]KRO15487.1 hypothetical protein IV56_GL002253 [Lacticaseibacillus saniviri JCM 17471 = DSM 24301]MCG4281307.1 GNAT family N-acetyltransferase [Lacticaseibacillus saniviri]
MIHYTFESGLTIHEIKALYGSVGMTDYLKDPAGTAMGLANSTMITARDDDQQLVGLIRGLSDMHTIAMIQDLLVMPDYQHQGIGHELLKTFTDYFKQVSRIVIVCNRPELASLYEKAGFVPESDTALTTFVHPRRLLEPRY